MMSSLYIGATGLKTHGEGMATITHNLANVNTVGYKQISMEFCDLVNQYVTASSANMTNVNQKGAGARPYDTRTLFTLGGIESGSAATDMCINGIGFFGVTDNGKTHYTRAGNFRFTKEGALVDPSGWTLLGKKIVNGVESTATTPIELDMSEQGLGYMAATASSYVTSTCNLGGLKDQSSDPANPYFALAANWNGSLSTPLGSSQYGYAEGIQFYDDTGTLQSATIYYDLAGSSGGLRAVEYLVAMDPARDGSALASTNAAGLLLAGTMTFGSNGDLVNLTAFTPPSSGDPADLAGWTPASTSNGKPAFTAQFGSTDPATGAISSGNANTVALDVGYTYGGASSTGGGLGSAADAAADPSLIYAVDASRTLDRDATTMLGDTQSGRLSARDGYSQGWLRDMHVGPDGITTGYYSNGQSQDLYRVVLYRFTSQDGLRNEGNNHFSATPDCGAIEEGFPGDENFGPIAEYALEQSNVDYAREFSRMIMVQRGFQMNSKVITTSDTMLQRALELKR